MKDLNSLAQVKLYNSSKTFRNSLLRSIFVLAFFILACEAYAMLPPLRDVTITNETSSGTINYKFKVFDEQRNQWKEAETGFRPTLKITAPASVDGVVFWKVDTSPFPNSPAEIFVYFSVYDPILGSWRTGNSAAGRFPSNPESRNGIVFWSASRATSQPYIDYRFAIYNPNTGFWIQTDVENQYDSSHGVGNVVIGDGVLAWLISHQMSPGNGLVAVRTYAFDVPRNAWGGGSTEVHNGSYTPVTINSITSGTVYYTVGSTQHTLGFDYRLFFGGWRPGFTIPLSNFVPSQTGGSVPLKIYFWDMSLGGASWSWNFGNGSTSTSQSPYYTYNTAFGSPFTATQTVTGPGGTHSSSRTITPTSTHSISGNSANLNGFKIAGATVTLSGTNSATTQTDSNGNFSFANLTGGGNYTVSISKTRYGFAPVTRTFNNLSGAQTGNFTGKLNDKPSDFDGDGKSDVSIFRPSTGYWWTLSSFDSSVSSTSWGIGTDVVTPRDFDGDGKVDLAVWRPSDGTWYVVHSSTGTTVAYALGSNGDIPVANDYDGDDKADYAVFRPSNQNWYVLKSSNAQLSIYQFGLSTDKPASGDYDGDEKADYAVFRPSNYTWYILRSSDSGVVIDQFGDSADKVVQGDYDADGKTDLATFRPGDTTWRVKRSSDATTQSLAWGLSTDILTPGDFDGDGKHDYGIFRPSNATWYIVRSSDQTGYTPAFGTNGDYPTLNSYIGN